MGIFDQSEYVVRCEWGAKGVEALAPLSDVVVIVDVLSFSTSVDISVSRGATVFPYRWRDERVYEYSRKVKAEVANCQNQNGYSLAPSTLENLPKNYRIVLPSPNGSTLTILAKEFSTVLCGCLRNAKSVAEEAVRLGKSISVIPCGERWHGDHSLRPCLEDILGAGAILSEIDSFLSPEAESAKMLFNSYSDKLFDSISKCSSGKEKLSQKKERDIELACDLNCSNSVPVLNDGAYQDRVLEPGR